MLKNSHPWLWFTGILLLSVNSALLRAEHLPADNKTSYTFGVVPQYEQRKLFAVWRPILDELELRTDFKFTLTGSPRIPSFEKDFEAGVYDFAYMNPYHVVQAQGEHSYLPLLRDGGRVLQGIVVVHKDSKIRSVKELHDQEVVFPSPNALGASLLIRSELKERYAIDLQPKYVQTHSSVYLFVAKQLAVSGGGVESTLAREKPEIRDSLRILYHTQATPPHPITAHKRVPSKHREQVIAAFLDLAQTAKGKYLLSQVPIELLVTTKFSDYKALSIMDFGDYREQ